MTKIQRSEASVGHKDGGNSEGMDARRIVLTGRQRQALVALRDIADSYLNGQVCSILDQDVNAIFAELGIDLDAACIKKKSIAEYRRGKEGVYIQRYHARSAWSDIPAHLHFPFQVKKRKDV